MAFTRTNQDYLAGVEVEVDYTIEARTGFGSSNTWAEPPYGYERGSLRITQDKQAPFASAEFTLIDQGLNLTDEEDEANRWQMGSEVKITAEYDSETEIVFQGHIEAMSSYEGHILIKCLDKCKVLHNTCASVFREAQTILISPDTALSVVSSNIYGFSISSTPEAFNPRSTQTSPLRRAFKKGVTLVLEGDNSQYVPPGEAPGWYEVPTSQYIVYPLSGVIAIYAPAGSYRVSNVEVYVEGTNDIGLSLEDALVTSDPDGPGFTTAQTKFNLTTDAGCTSTVMTIKNSTTRFMKNAHLVEFASGEIRLIDSISSDAIFTIRNEVRRIGTGSTDTKIFIADYGGTTYGQMNLWDFDGVTYTAFAGGQQVTINGETRTISAVGADHIDLSVALSGAPSQDDIIYFGLKLPPAPNQAIIYYTSRVGLDLDRIDWEESDGNIWDLWQGLTRVLPEDVLVLSYLPGNDTFEIRIDNQAPAPEFDLTDERVVSSVTQPRDLEALFTKVIAKGVIVSPENIARSSTVYDAFDGDAHADVQEKGYNGKQAPKYGADVAADWSITKDSWKDGNSNTAFGWTWTAGGHSSSHVTTFYNLAIFDMGQDRKLKMMVLVAPGSQNINQQDPSEGVHKYKYKVQVARESDYLGGSKDDASNFNWYDISPVWSEISMNPSTVEQLLEEDIQFTDLVRYVLIQVKPAKDGATNYDSPYAGLAELQIYETLEYSAEAKINDTAGAPDPVEIKLSYSPYILEFDRYQPKLLTKLGGRHRTHFLQLGNSLDESDALNLAYIHLNEFVRSFQEVRIDLGDDPFTLMGASISVTDKWTGNTVDFLVERKVFGPGYANIYGRNWRAGILGGT